MIGLRAFPLAPLLALSVLLAAVPAYSTTYEVVAIEPLPGDSRSEAFAINGAGQVAATSYDAANRPRPFLWFNGTATPIALGAWEEGTTYAINRNGLVAGVVRSAVAGKQAWFLWNGSDLQVFSESDVVTSRVTGVNDLGVACFTTSDLVSIAYAHDSDGYNAELVIPSRVGTEARCINNASAIAGASLNLQNHFVPTAWPDFRRGMHDQPVLLPSRGGDGFVNAINNRNVMFGSCYDAAPRASMRAVRWWMGGDLHEFGTLGGRWSGGNGLNDREPPDMVGTSETADQRVHGFLIPGSGAEAGQMLDLNALIPVGSGWELQSASAINDGVAILGNGVHDGEGRAFVMRPVIEQPGVKIENPTIIEAGISISSTDGGNSKYATSVADDWVCPDGVPIGRVEWSGSYLGWASGTSKPALPPAESRPTGFRLSWCTSEASGFGAVPGVVLGSATITEYTETWEATYPVPGALATYQHVYRYTCTLPELWKQSQGTEYFLIVQAYFEGLPPNHDWGWAAGLGPKISNPSVSRMGTEAWSALIWPKDYPRMGQDIDMAFSLLPALIVPTPLPTPIPTPTAMPTPTSTPIPTPIPPPTPTPCTRPVGYLPTVSGPFIPPRDLVALHREFVPQYHSEIIVNPVCFGGSFNETLASRPRAAILSGTTDVSPFEVGWYGGYGDDAILALRPGPGRTTTDVHNAGIAGKDRREHPTLAGVVASLEPTSATGPIRKRFVLMYTGRPERWDATDRDRLKANFAGQYQTVVWTLGGAGGNGWDSAATLDNLRNVYRDLVAPFMTPDAQLIVVMGDHGGLTSEACATVVPATISVYIPIMIDLTLVQQRRTLAKEFTGSGFSLRLSGKSDIKPGSIALRLSQGAGRPPKRYSEFTAEQKDLNGDGDTGDEGEGIVLYFPTPLDDLLPPKAKADADTQLDLVVENLSPEVLTIEEALVDLGSIAPLDPAVYTPTPVPEEGFLMY